MQQKFLYGAGTTTTNCPMQWRDAALVHSVRIRSANNQNLDDIPLSRFMEVLRERPAVTRVMQRLRTATIPGGYARAQREQLRDYSRQISGGGNVKSSVSRIGIMRDFVEEIRGRGAAARSRCQGRRRQRGIFSKQRADAVHVRGGNGSKESEEWYVLLAAVQGWICSATLRRNSLLSIKP